MTKSELKKAIADNLWAIAVSTMMDLHDYSEVHKEDTHAKDIDTSGSFHSLMLKLNDDVWYSLRVHFKHGTPTISLYAGYDTMLLTMIYDDLSVIVETFATYICAVNKDALED